MNTVSCWPKLEDGGHPTAAQTAACRGNLKDQLDVVPAKYILACGAHALEAMIKHAKLKHVAGQLIPVHGKQVYPVYHPSYIQRANDPTLMKKWGEQIEHFAFLMHWDITGPTEGNCLYCNKVRYGDMITCYGHKDEWRKDQAWTRRGGRKKKMQGQETLFN